MKNFVWLVKVITRRSRAGFKAFKNNFFGVDYATQSYSQYAEDMVLRSIFCRFPKVNYEGFYVDVGAHHPKRFSNTYHFYLNGWRGICIDPIPDGEILFSKYRPRDVFLNIGVSEHEGEFPYKIFSEPGLNTFSEEFSKFYETKPIQTKMFTTLPLKKIFAEHLPDGCVINFLSIDAEGFDLQILRSNDWGRFRPQIVLFEEGSVGLLKDIMSLEANSLMNKNDYQAIAKIPSGLIYVDINSPSFNGSAYLNYV